MIPYLQVAPLRLGPLVLDVFPVLVMVGVFVGVIEARKEARRLGLDPDVMSRVAPWSVIPGFVVSHLVAMLFYFPERLAERPLEILNITGGMSGMGGFVGGALGLILWMRWNAVDLWPYTNPATYGFAHGWIFGRLACAIVHDHPGTPTVWPLGVDYPARDGFPAGPRHDLGLYELFVTLALVAWYRSTRSTPRWGGWHPAVFAGVFGVFRLVADPLRVADARYGGLTAGQWIGLVAIAWGFAVARRQRGTTPVGAK
jgi:phosphatidylglycerol:prolipoprotein diacylglycerol transferase